MAEPMPEPLDERTLAEHDANWTAFAYSPWDHPHHRQALDALKANARLQRAGCGMHRWQAIAAALRGLRLGPPSPAETGLTLKVPHERRA